MTLTFEPFERPFPRWMGPFSPARGTRSGFRFHGGRLGTWVRDATSSSFWSVAPSRGAERIADLVRRVWGGGRVLLLPNGFVVKPLPGNAAFNDDEVGRRVLIGRFAGALVLERPDRSRFDMSDPGPLRPGDLWPGPGTTGLECVIQGDGSLICAWYHPSFLGRDGVRHMLRGSDPTLYAAFRRARPDDGGGRVRITANGHVITNRNASGIWTVRYVGCVAQSSLVGNWEGWIMEERG